MKKTSLALAFLAFSGGVVAKDFDYAIGASVNYANIKYEDNDGMTATETFVLPIRLFGELELDRTNKIQSGWRMVDFSLDATTSGDMGATFEGDQFDASWLHQLRLGRNFKPWIGAGVRISMVDVIGKHEIDTEGFLVQRFEPVSDTVLSGLVQAYYEFPIGRSGWFIDASATYEAPVSGDGLAGFGAGVGIKFEL